MTFICLRGLLLTELAAAQGSILRRRNHLEFNFLPVTVLKFLTILSLTVCFISEAQWDNRGSARGWELHLVCGPALRGENLSAILSAPPPLLSDLCHLPWQGSGHSSGRGGVRPTPSALSRD